jgi:hypothetical protein
MGSVDLGEGGAAVKSQVLWSEKELRHLWCDGMTRMTDPEAQQLDEERFAEVAEVHLVPKILQGFSARMQKKVYSQ